MIGRRQRSSTVKKLAIGTGVAAAAGFVAGVLTAPKSGKETRADLKSAASKSYVQTEKELKKLHTDLGKIIEDSRKHGGKLSDKAQQELGVVVEKAKTAKNKAREVLSAVHEGDADDQDLKRAVEDARAAIAHLKDYLKK
jgi:gas vesicle protein